MVRPQNNCRSISSSAFYLILGIIITTLSTNIYAVNCWLCGKPQMERGGWFKCSTKGCEAAKKWAPSYGKGVYLKAPLQQEYTKPQKPRMVTGRSPEAPLCPECKDVMGQSDKWFRCRNPECDNSAWVPMSSADRLLPDRSLNWEARIFRSLDYNTKCRLKQFHSQPKTEGVFTLDQLIMMLNDQLLPGFLETAKTCMTCTSYRLAMLGSIAELIEEPVEIVERAIKTPMVFHGGLLSLYNKFNAVDLAYIRATDFTFDPLVMRLKEFQTSLPKGSIEKMMSLCEKNTDLRFVCPEIIREPHELAKVKARLDANNSILLVVTYNDFYQHLYVSPYEAPLSLIFSSESKVKKSKQVEYVEIMAPGLPSFPLKTEHLTEAFSELWQTLENAPALLLTHQKDMPKLQLRSRQKHNPPTE
ncbi:hypothetical protein ACWJJH_14975 [Endozoicomonadaceae bacterium StTr2]